MSEPQEQFSLYGLDLLGDPVKPMPPSPIGDRFIFPPFSVLDARAGEWQDRKRQWISIGIQSEIGREENLLAYSETVGIDGKNTSIFDAVLCELMTTWFCPKGGQIVDPFSGGSVRGIIAGCLGRKYWGCDLRKEQIEANILQAEEILPQIMPRWICGDAMEALDRAPQADFIFSCPPYGDLEKYSEDERDLSAMDWEDFLAAYKYIIRRAIDGMKPDGFACFVVGDFRCPRGYYRNFVSHTIEGFEAAGARLYNEAILATPVGSAPLRIARQFDSTRKFCKVHQNVLVFAKGNPRVAAERCIDNIGRSESNGKEIPGFE